MSKTLLVASLLTLMVVSSAAAYGQGVPSPPRREGEQAPVVQQKTEHPAGTVTAIIVKSWGNNPVWADLNTNWANYGSVPVSIDYTTLISSDFTYQDLVNANADVIILSDPAGGLQQYSTAEIDAVSRYVKDGHSIVGTYLTFEWSSTNDTGLAPIFGFSSTLSYEALSISNEFTKLIPKLCLFNNISGKTWQSEGYADSQVPSSGTWTGNLGTAKAAADSDTYVGVVAGHKGKAYTSIYISNMPEYEVTGGPDEQLLYNAITCYAP